MQPSVSRPLETNIHDDVSISSRNTRRRLARDEPSRSSSMDIDILPPAVQLARAKEALKNEFSSEQGTH